MTQPAEKTYNVTVWFKSFTYATREVEAESPEDAAKIADDDAEPWFNDSEDGEPDESPQFIRVTDRDTDTEYEFDRDPVRAELAKVKAERDNLLSVVGGLLDWADEMGGWQAPAWINAEVAVGRRSPDIEKGEG